MPYYYLISEVPDSRDEPIHYDIRNYKKPETINLLLPSIHASREDNVLDTGSDAEEAVRNLHASCRDSGSWPSYEYSSIADSTSHNNRPSTSVQTSSNFDPMQDESRASSGLDPASLAENTLKSQAPVFSKYRPPFWAYDSIRPELLDAARALFYERKRQQVMYGGITSWSHSGSPRYPTDYELFTAWASLPRPDKMAYISEVSGSHSASLITSDSLSTQRAVTSLLASCPDSCSWPSFQFSRLQAQQRQPPPHQHPRNYPPYHPYHLQPPALPNPIPFMVD